MVVSMAPTRIVTNSAHFSGKNALDNKSLELLYVLCLLRAMSFYTLMSRC